MSWRKRYGSSLGACGETLRAGQGRDIRLVEALHETGMKMRREAQHFVGWYG